MKNSILNGKFKFSLAFLKIAIVIVLIGNFLVLTSCGSKGWSCKGRYVYVPMTKEYIKKHQQGADSFDRTVLNKKTKP